MEVRPRLEEDRGARWHQDRVAVLCLQIRSYPQKYFLKVLRLGLAAVLLPQPRDPQARGTAADAELDGRKRHDVARVPAVESSRCRPNHSRLEQSEIPPFVQ